MAWYDAFATFYDRSLEKLYAPYREQAFADVDLRPDSLVLDVACGTSQNYSALGLEQAGAWYIGVDKSAGMLRAAAKRIGDNGRAALWEKAIADVTPETLKAHAGKPGADLLVCTLGLTVVPNWEQVWADSWRLLSPGGRAIVMDVVAEDRTFQTWTVEKMAQADLSREVWRPLEADGEGFSRVITDAPPSKMGGRLYFVTATKPLS